MVDTKINNLYAAPSVHTGGGYAQITVWLSDVKGKVLDLNNCYGPPGFRPGWNILPTRMGYVN